VLGPLWFRVIAGAVGVFLAGGGLSRIGDPRDPWYAVALLVLFGVVLLACALDSPPRSGSTAGIERSELDGRLGTGFRLVPTVAFIRLPSVLRWMAPRARGGMVHVSEWGVCMRGPGSWELGWDEISGVDVAFVNGVRHMRIHRFTAALPIFIAMHLTESDPKNLLGVLEHMQANPSDRWLLTSEDLTAHFRPS
jgi:hypothetical protein